MSEGSEMKFDDTPLRTVRRRWMCGIGGCFGEMIPTGAMLLSSPPQFPHRCNICGAAKSAHSKYPVVMHIPLP